MNTAGHRTGAAAPARWREEEDNILRAYVKQYTELGCATDWRFVAEKLPRRTNKDCRKRWVNHICGGLRKGPWEPDEDMILRDAVAQYGQKWTLVAGEVGSRSADQCAKRWKHNLDPRLDHQRWTPKEDELLLESVERYGREWSKIQEKHYSTRSANDLKNRFTILSKRIRSRASSRSRLGSSVEHPSSTFPILIADDQDQESSSRSTDSGAVSRPSSSTSPDDSGGSVYNPQDLQMDLDEIMQSTTNLQQQHEQQVQSRGQPVALLPSSHDYKYMTINNHEPAPPSTFPWSANTTPPSWGKDASSFETNTKFADPILSNSLTTMLHHPFQPSPTETGDNNNNALSNNSNQMGDTNMGGALVLGFDAMDTSVPNGMKNSPLHTVLVQRAERLANCSPGGTISLQGQGCDREVLNYLLDVLLPIRHLVKIDINV